MEVKEAGFIRCFGSTTVGSRGQVVIPVNARKELGLSPGSTLLVFHAPHGHGLFLLKTDTIETMLNTMSEGLSRFEKLLEDYLPNEKTGRKKE